MNTLVWIALETRIIYVYHMNSLLKIWSGGVIIRVLIKIPYTANTSYRTPVFILECRLPCATTFWNIFRNFGIVPRTQNEPIFLVFILAS